MSEQDDNENDMVRSIFVRHFTKMQNNPDINITWKYNFRHGNGVIVRQTGRRYTFRRFKDLQLIDYPDNIASSEFIGIELKPAGARLLEISVTENMWIGISTPENKDSPIGKVIMI